MILRRTTLSCVSLFLLCLVDISLALAEDESPFDCHLQVDSYKFDLTLLGDEHTVSRKRDSPPTSMLDTVRFDICTDLKAQEGVAKEDQCPPGTRVCLTTTNQKLDQTDRIVSVIPVVQTASMKPSYSALSSPRGLSLILHGPSYPHPTNSTPIPQFLNLTVLCNTENSDPKFVSYDGTQLQIEWTSSAGCGFQGEGDNGGSGGDKGDDSEKRPERVGSGIGWFFLMLLLAFIGYLGLGAYYNYTTYGASGVDLIPHRDFWREVPYMLGDVVSHLCSNARPRRTSSRGGYIAV